MRSIESAMQKVQEGNTAYYEFVVEQLQQPIYHYCYHLLGQAQEAEDAMQDAFLIAYEKIKQCTDPTSFKAWLYKIAYNHCINIIRRKNRIHFLSFSSISHGSNPSPESIIDRTTLSEPLHMVLNTLYYS